MSLPFVDSRKAKKKTSWVAMGTSVKAFEYAHARFSIRRYGQAGRQAGKQAGAARCARSRLQPRTIASLVPTSRSHARSRFEIAASYAPIDTKEGRTEGTARKAGRKDERESKERRGRSSFIR